MNPTIINIYDLQHVSSLSPVRCADFSEAAAVCLDSHDHKSGKLITIDGNWNESFKLIWEEVTLQMKASRNDMEDTVESGAYCIAMLLIERLVGFQVLKQSQKRTGFDYWLGNKDEFGMQGLARLEVSGILKGTLGQINRRLKEKVEQTKKSDKLSLPAYVVVVEFSKPQVRIQKR